MTEVIFPNPFKAEGRWFRGNIHSHTTFSDGVLTPSQLVYLYRESDYDFLAITDHGVVANIEGLSSEDFLVIPGIELAIGRAMLGDCYHIIGLGFKDMPNLERLNLIKNPQEIIDFIRDLDGEVIVAHPYWSMLTLEDLLSLEGYLGIEVFNTTCSVSIGKGFSTVHWDELLVSGKYVYGFAVDDTHWHFDPYRPVDALGGWIMVKAPQLSMNSILEALRRGLFYSSMGPIIRDIEILGDEIIVRCSPVKSIAFIADHSKGRKFTAKEALLKEARYRMRGDEAYIRIECVDSRGRVAWSNHIILE